MLTLGEDEARLQLGELGREARKLGTYAFDLGFLRLSVDLGEEAALLHVVADPDVQLPELP